jgi:hypothetical protein
MFHDQGLARAVFKDRSRVFLGLIVFRHFPIALLIRDVKTHIYGSLLLYLEVLGGRCGSSSSVPPSQVQSPEFKPQDRNKQSADVFRELKLTFSGNLPYFKIYIKLRLLPTNLVIWLIFWQL